MRQSGREDYNFIGQIFDCVRVTGSTLESKPILIFSQCLERSPQ